MYNPNDTIVTIASGPGGAIGIIRLSGKDTFDICKNFLIPNKCFTKPSRAYHMLKIMEPSTSKIIDRAIVVLYPQPKSYTGENMVEIFTHNSPYIVKKTLDIAIQMGARQAREGEFTLRAFLNGKMDLSQAEAINQLIKAETEKQHRIAINQLEGKLSKKVNEIKAKLIDLLSEIEVRIDDSYEEVDDIEVKIFLKNLEDVILDIDKLSQTYNQANFIHEGIKIAICGSPNSGKSTLLNSLIGYERVITSPIPGTTRDIIEVSLEINGFKTIFYDTAGIRDTKDPIELKGIEKTFSVIKNSDIIIVLKDPFEDENNYNKVINRIRENARKDAKIIEVISKADLVKEKTNDKILMISATTNYNIKKLTEIITSDKEKMIDDVFDEIIVSKRHYECLIKAREELNKIKKIAFSNYELISEHLRKALDEIEAIAGKTLPEDILENIFSKFCVGK